VITNNHFMPGGGGHLCDSSAHCAGTQYSYSVHFLMRTLFKKGHKDTPIRDRWRLFFQK
jgi:hypothetical protein